MKKISALMALLSIFTLTIHAQSEKDVISAKEITWLGLDFSKALFVGSFTQFAEAGEQSGSEIKQKYIPGWNDLVANERPKFDLKKAYKKENVLYDLDIVTKRNAAVDVSKMTSMNAQDDRIKKEDIAKVVSHYKTGKKGIGLVYIVDTFDKPDEKGIIWVTFFDMATQKVLIAEKFTAKPGGFGLRNYWAKTVFEVMTKSSADAYEDWAKTYK
jgi:hypothetical protein